MKIRNVAINVKYVMLKRESKFCHLKIKQEKKQEMVNCEKREENIPRKYLNRKFI